MKDKETIPEGRLEGKDEPQVTNHNHDAEIHDELDRVGSDASEKGEGEDG
jgi:hypothetical protein